MSIGNIWFCKATILCFMFIFMLYFVCDISKKKHKRSTAVLFEYLKWLNFCSVNKKERKLRTNCAIVFCYIVVLLLFPVLTIKQSCSPWIAHKDVEIYWTDIYMFLFHIKCDFERKGITEHSILCRPPFMILFFLCLTMVKLMLVIVTVNLSYSISVHWNALFSRLFSGILPVRVSLELFLNWSLLMMP